MADVSRFVHIVDDAQPAGPDEGAAGPVLVHSLDGFLDAGNAGAIAVRQMLAVDGGRVVASFAVDEFHDYRARRPALTFAQDHYEAYDAPRLVVRRLVDSAGTAYLLLHGPEPDMQWEGFAAAVRRVVEHFGVRRVVALGSVPMAVPHTRPVKLTQHATGAHLMTQTNMWTGDIRVPSSAQALLEIRLGEWGHDAMGYVAHIPHYVAQFDYPHAAVALLEAVGAACGLSWELDGLREEAARKAGEIAGQIADSEEVREVVRGLEEQYDAFERASTGSLLAEEKELPTGDELGTQFEAFLAGLNPDRSDDDEPGR